MWDHGDSVCRALVLWVFPSMENPSQRLRGQLSGSGGDMRPAAHCAASPRGRIATGVIEGGVCRHLVKDRMDITGARWGLDGAEAILKSRALRSNGNWDDYWPYHLAQERQRIHHSRYSNNQIPQAA